MKYIIAHDFGTSALKSAIYSTEGELIGHHTTEYPSERNGDQVEQDPENWWSAFCAANELLTKGIDRKDVACVTFDGVTAALVCCDRAGKPLHRAITWQDGRATAEAKEVMSLLTTPELKAGRNFMGPGRTCVLLYWIRKHWPEVLEKTHKVCLNNANFVVSRLIGKAVTDYEIAGSGALLCADREKGWDTAFLNVLGVPERILPELHSMDEVVGAVPKSLAEECGLAAGTKVLTGGDDGRMVTMGTGIVHHGDAGVTCGTSGGVTVFGAKMSFPGTNAVGSTLEWIRRCLCAEEERAAEEEGVSVFDRIAQAAERSPVGANGVLFLPYLTNERGYRRNPKTKGVFFGLGLTTTHDDLLRAGIEGILLNLYGYVKRFREEGHIIKVLNANGGLSKSPIIRQMMADITGSYIVTMQNSAWSGPTGCAMLACTAIGEAADIFEAEERFVRMESMTEPDPKNHEKYEKIYELWEALYEAQLPLFEKQFDLQNH